MRLQIYRLYIKKKRRSKLYLSGFIGIFMGYNINTDSQYRVYSIDILKFGIYNTVCILFNKTTYGFLSISLSLDF